MNEQFNNRLSTTPSRELSGSRPRFQRQTTPPSRSNSSKSSQASNQKYIRFDSLCRTRLDPDHFFSGFSKEMVDVRSDEDSRSRRKSARSPANPAIRIQTLQADLEQAQEEVENLRRENVRLKAALEREIERRKNCEKRAQAGSAELGESQRRCREWEELAGSLRKEVRFLEDVRTNREERVLVSLRERALAEEVQRLRSHLPPPLAALEREVQRLRQLNHSLASDNNALSIAHTTILMRLLHFQKQLSLALTLEHEFRLLRDKYEQLAAKERLQRRELDRERRKHYHHQQQQQQESNNASKDESRDESDNEELLTISSSSTERVRARQLKLKLEGRRGRERKPNGC